MPYEKVLPHGGKFSLENSLIVLPDKYLILRN